MPQRSTDSPPFEQLNSGYNAVFQQNQLSLGLVVPIEAYPRTAVPTMVDHINRVRMAESLGFSAVWLRDVPFNVASFGDAGQTFDPFVYLGALAARTSTIALGVASVILPLRHPAHVAKAAATADVLSDGRLLLGIASGDRPDEYPATGVAYVDRGERFRDSYAYIRNMAAQRPSIANGFGHVAGIDMLPKPVAQRLPLLITGSSQQSNEWIARHADGWMTYPRPANQQLQLIDDFRGRVSAAGDHDKPVMEPLYIDLVADRNAAPQPIHLGLRLGVNALCDYLRTRQQIGVNHVALNLRFNNADIPATLQTLADAVIPEFSR
ncbi:MAG: LLM class oxidoreductase [Pseudomonadota bacterium]